MAAAVRIYDLFVELHNDRQMVGTMAGVIIGPIPATSLRLALADMSARSRRIWQRCIRAMDAAVLPLLNGGGDA